MRKILLCLCFVFAVGLLFSACGKDDIKQNLASVLGDIQTYTDLRDGQTPISQEEQSAIDNSSDLAGGLAGKTFEIFELRFGSKYIDADTTGAEVVENGAVYHLVFGIKDNDGNVMYKTIDATGAEWTLEDNVAVTKDDDKGFKVKDDFYAENGNVSVRVDINYKGLSKTFNFVLKSNKDKPATPTPNPEPTPDPTPTPLVPAPELPAQIINGKQLALNMQFGYTKAGRVIQSNQTIEIKRGVGLTFTEYIKIGREPYFFETDTKLSPYDGTPTSGLPDYSGHKQVKYYWNNQVVDSSVIGQYLESAGNSLAKFKASVPVGSELKYEFTIIDFGDSIDNLTPVNMSAYIIIKVIE